MLKYNFVITVNENPVTKKERREKVFGVEPPYHMLSNLSYSCQDVNFVKQLIEKLKKLLSLELDHYGYWGHDMTIVMSYPEKSEVVHTYVDDQNKIVEGQIEVPTSWILKLMEDWLIYLEKDEDSTDSVVHGVWIPPS